MAITGVWHEITCGQYRARIAEVGAGLAGLSHAGRALTTPWPDDSLPPMSSGAVLLPWPNRIRDGKYRFEGNDFQLPLSEPAKGNASHGLVRWERWNVGASAEDSVTLQLDVVPQTGYPFELSCALTYRLDAEAGLRVELAAANIGARRAPFGVGFHPYLDLGGHDLDHVEVDVPGSVRLVTDDRQIPVGREAVHDTPYQLHPKRSLGSLRVDDGYTELQATSASVTVAGSTTEIWWDEHFGYLQVFTPPLQRFGTTALAIEPMTCPANAFSSGESLIALEPGETFTAAWGIRALG